MEQDEFKPGPACIELNREVWDFFCGSTGSQPRPQGWGKSPEDEVALVPCTTSSPALGLTKYVSAYMRFAVREDRRDAVE